MAHKTLVGGTAYNITGGKSMVSGTVYNIVKGKTLVNGTGYNINFDLELQPIIDRFVLYNTGDFVFQNAANYEEGKTHKYSGSFRDTDVFYNANSVSWNNCKANIINVYATGKISPFNTAYWFYNCRNLIHCNYENFNMTGTYNMQHMFSYCYKLNDKPICGNSVTDMSFAYDGAGITGPAVCGPSVRNMVNTYNDCTKLTGSPVCGEKVTNMAFSYSLCGNITGAPVCGNNVVDMRHTYRGCTNLIGPPVIGPKVEIMYYTYGGCYNLKGSPITSNKIVNMDSAYSYCYNLTGNPVCGPNVVSFAYAYEDCYNLTGSPVCGNKVVNMAWAYSGCNNLTGSPVCGPNVNSFSGAYDSCHKIVGPPVCGAKITNMSHTYRNCYNLTGNPICGNNVTSANYTYENCRNISSNAYFYSSNIEYVRGCFNGKNNSKRLNLYVPANSITNTTVHNTTNKYTLVYDRITWTNAGSYQYNTAYNIYIYPVANVAATAIANGDEEANVNAGVIAKEPIAEPTHYAVEPISGSTYGFTFNEDGYYESNNKGVGPSYALCKVTFVADGVNAVYFDCINFAESNYDYGILSNVDTTLTTNVAADTSNVFKSFKGSQSASIQTVNYGVLSAGEHFVYVKYIKDGSVNRDNDSLQFNVRFATSNNPTHGGGSN